MKKLIALFGLPILLVACGGSAEKTTEGGSDKDTTNLDTAFVDSIIVIADSTRPATDVDALLALGDENIWELPLKMDSVFYVKTFGESEDAYSEEPAEYNMSYKDAYHLAHTWLKNQATDRAAWDVTTFIKMDSLIAHDKMEDYQNSIDIGMARYATADVFGKVKLSDRSILLLWKTDYATYEACPYGYGTCIFGTLFTDSIAINSTVLWEVSGGGDPPVWGETAVNSIIDVDGITLYYTDRFGEEDYDTGEEIIEETLDTFLIEITPLELVDIEELEEH